MDDRQYRRHQRTASKFADTVYGMVVCNCLTRRRILLLSLNDALSLLLVGRS